MSSALTWMNLCQGGGGQCDCKHFRPKADDPAHCWECSHGFNINTPAVNAPAITQLQPAMTISNKCKPSQQQTSGQMFHTLTLQIEIQANGQLMKDLILPQMTSEKRLFIQHLENHGCHLQQTTEVNSSWSHEDVTAQLHSWFPNVFQYFDSHREKANMNMTSQTQPDWQLLVPANGRLELSTAVRLNGIVLSHFKGCQKSGIADSNLWFVTRNPVPNHIFDKWKVGLDVVGTDEEATSESDNEVVELLSSIADLEITMATGTGKRSWVMFY
ncbi:hypothetical protein F5J12DRAFT_783488 [Pisolithus orientalis]|uniref:uncharacterized protein n=1 Tax=Pisolithus orientalis TaxID=936130 RepID=UPI0022252D74|nr:uncharacterized protein F5J12DRAFT_783488 [Pisolithus orientalis]KAI6004528.1 hypothetical protein F5J12DRAFT_783488 [Pisolithus orientalis]